MNVIFVLGLILLVGFLAVKAVGKIKLPSVTAYLLLGIVMGPSFLNLISADLLGYSGFISNVVLSFIAFSIGQNFYRENFRQIGKTVLWISVLEAFGAWLFVTFAFIVVLHQPVHVAILFGAIASATAPAATMMIIRQYKAKGVFTNTLMGVVAIDDAWCLVIFALSLAVAKSISGQNHSFVMVFGSVFYSLVHIVGAFLLGGVLGWLMVRISRLIRTTEELLVYTLSFVLLCSGLATHLHFSLLLSNMFMGMVLVNTDKQSEKFFNVLQTVDSPLYLFFFVFAGASLEIGLLKKLGIMGITYIVFRVAGKMLGAYTGGRIAMAAASVRKYMGIALIPQAGVALGVALIAKADFPEVGSIIITTIVATTVVYELIGPLCTKIALQKAGEI